MPRPEEPSLGLANTTSGMNHRTCDEPDRTVFTLCHTPGVPEAVHNARDFGGIFGGKGPTRRWLRVVVMSTRRKRQWVPTNVDLD